MVLVPVRFITTAATPVSGHAAATVDLEVDDGVRAERRLRGADAGAGVEDAGRHERHELATLVGLRGEVGADVGDTVLAGNQPTTSNSTCVSPA